MESKGFPMKLKGFPVISPEIRNQNPSSIFYPDLSTALADRSKHNEKPVLLLIETPQNKVEELLLGVSRAKLFKVGDHKYMSNQIDEQGRNLSYVIGDQPVNSTKEEPLFSINQVLVQGTEHTRVVDLASLVPSGASLKYSPAGYYNRQNRYLFSGETDAILLPMFYEDDLSQKKTGDPTTKFKVAIAGRQIALILHEIGHLWDLTGSSLWRDIPKELGAMVAAANLKDWGLYKMMFGWNLGPIIGALYERNVGSETTKDYKVARERNASAVALLLKKFLKKNGFDLDVGKDAKSIASEYETDLFRYDLALSMGGIANTFASSWYRKMQQPKQ